LRSSSIVGGGEALNQVIGLVRTKLVAVLIGPAGMGLVGLYVSAAGFLGTIALLGINQSGVRAVAEAAGEGDVTRVSQVAKTLRRACWITGIFGWLLTAAVAYPLSLWTFESSEHSTVIALLGCTVLLTALAGGETALINGVRRVGDLARIQVYSSVVTTIVAIGIYAWLREKGIVPVIILTGAIQAAVSYYFARKIGLVAVDQSWTETVKNLRGLISLGLAFMYTGFLVNLVGLGTRTLVVREEGLEANGFYQAAWMISGMLATFILNAMGRDFFPRITAVHGDSTQISRLVNEQMEVGILLGLPGLVGTVSLGHWLTTVLYSSKFVPAAELLPFFCLGVFLRLVSWPMGFVLLAKNLPFAFSAIASIFQATQLALTLLFLQQFGLPGAAAAFAAAEMLQLFLYYCAARKVCAYRISTATAKIAVAGLLGMAAACAVFFVPSALSSFALGVALSVASGIACLVAIGRRLPENHAVISLFGKLPLLGSLLGKIR
jgi:PST family polysaccharide transporter